MNPLTPLRPASLARGLAAVALVLAGAAHAGDVMCTGRSAYTSRA